MKTITLIVLLNLSMVQTTQAQSTIYKCVVKGKTIYSESPCKENAYNENIFEVNNERMGNVSPDRQTIEETRARIRHDMNKPNAQSTSTGKATRTTSNKNFVCTSIEEEIKNLDSAARQPISGWQQDQIKNQKMDAQRRKNEYGCG